MNVGVNYRELKVDLAVIFTIGNSGNINRLDNLELSVINTTRLKSCHTIKEDFFIKNI